MSNALVTVFIKPC